MEFAPAGGLEGRLAAPRSPTPLPTAGVPTGMAEGRGDRLRHGDRDPAAQSASAIDLTLARLPNSASKALSICSGSSAITIFLAIVLNATRTPLPDGVPEPLKRYPN
jgi:hypothetical protein